MCWTVRGQLSRKDGIMNNIGLVQKRCRRQPLEAKGKAEGVRLAKTGKGCYKHQRDLSTFSNMTVNDVQH